MPRQGPESPSVWQRPKSIPSSMIRRRRTERIPRFRDAGSQYPRILFRTPASGLLPSLSHLHSQVYATNYD